MKRLHLIRHAKSSWQDTELDDHERALNARGQRDAPRMGAALAQRLKTSSPIHCSSALRARQTLDGLCAGWPGLAGLEHRIDPSLYTFDAGDLLGWLKEFGHADVCFLLGHNPALTYLCNRLVGSPALDNLPTCGYLELSLPIADWSDVTEGVANLEGWLFPRDLT